jgi:cell division protein FtsA
MIAQNPLYAALDIGSAHMCCMVAEENSEGTLTILGLGHQASSGIKAGQVIALNEAAHAAARALHQAEEAAHVSLRRVVSGLSGLGLVSEHVTVELDGNVHEIGEYHVRRLAHMAVANQPADRHVVHSVPLAYTLDEATGLENPRGMFGARLGATFHVITAAAPVVQSLQATLRRCMVEVESLVVPAYAAGMAALVEDERRLGATVIDMGAGTTSVAVFQEGVLSYVDSLPIGSHHITLDIARGLSTPLAEAERLKILHGAAVSHGFDDREILDVPLVGEVQAPNIAHLPRSFLLRIIQPRVEEIFEEVRVRLEHAGVLKNAGRLVVLTGGGSLLPGVREAAALSLGKKVRLGKPPALAGLPPDYQTAPYAAVVGMLLLAQEQRRRAAGALSLWQRAWGWVRENF